MVSATGTGCVIRRDPTGAFVVSHSLQPGRQLRVATLACAYAACRDWERHHPPHPDGGGEPAVAA
ncbi:MAG: hypothetical protein VKI81_03710 [Synechococcaceae cyanobacterium]|nr:hypothetical protein [Synechococcaceae cyanobacterium]